MKRTSPFIAAALLLLLASCSSTAFMKRKYMPGHFFNAPVSMNGNSVSTGQEITVQPQVNDLSNEFTEQTTGSVIISKDAGLKDMLSLAKTIRTAGPLNVLKKELGIHSRPFLVGQKNKAPMSMGSDKRKGMGWLSLICGVLTFYPLLFSSLALALLAIIFGMITFHRVRNDSSKYGGKGLAFLGMFLGILGVTLILLGVIAMVA